MKINWKVLIISLVVVYLIAFLGGIFTSKNVSGAWYMENKPGITPPSYIFPIVWNILFFLIAISLYLSWIKAKKNKKEIAFAFGINLILNFLWSVLFFGYKLIGLALIDLVLIWISILFMIKITWKVDRRAAYLLIPYLLWVSFAGILNYLFLI